ncbi:hypothetical protein A8L34_08490 [Bacillus sp. FJAT-27264]|uniref:DUF5071 domain-containing protein n=1 Tax=Paenibacillus sp. (strain DSM 101736 / FJAT-27264) TaxID=1850362 RepID=UPI000807E8BC|nr:DUF5071 domain-containing protein [Bacillus sp. FJAT-27264]OBZ14003.1 hypothetical protein A8L34_08490 [Bacillus sp. FJAT-27264]
MNHTYLPVDKHDFKSVEALASMEREIVIPLLPELLVWIQDRNWPISSAMADLLLQYKIEIIPHLRTIFSQTDSSWTYNILAYLIKEWNTELISELSSSLRELAQTMDHYEDTDLLSIQILYSHRLIETEEATELLVRKAGEIEATLHNFTKEQKVTFTKLEHERLHILNTDARGILNYIEVNRKSLNEKDQYENLLRRYQEIETMINTNGGRLNRE